MELPYRSDCRCDCHGRSITQPDGFAEPICKHVMPCCQPDPIPSYVSPQEAELFGPMIEILERMRKSDEYIPIHRPETESWMGGAKLYVNKKTRASLN